MPLRAVVAAVYENEDIGSLVIELKPSSPPEGLKLPELKEAMLLGSVEEGLGVFMLVFPCELVGEDGPTLDETNAFGEMICTAVGLDASHQLHISVASGLVAYDSDDRAIRYPVVDGELLLVTAVQLLKDLGQEPDAAARVVDALQELPQWQS